MVKSVSSVNHQGLKDWIIQRVTALVMIVYTVALMWFFITTPTVGFYEWHELFVGSWMKIGTLLFLLSVMYHAWIGMWTIFTDYVKPYVLRCILNLAVILALCAFFLEGFLILWGV